MRTLGNSERAYMLLFGEHIAISKLKVKKMVVFLLELFLLNEISWGKEVSMGKKLNEVESEVLTKLGNELATLNRKSDAMLAILLRHLNDEGLEKWDKQDKSNIVKMLINVGFDNPEISRVTGLAYGSVANIRSKSKKGESK
jgi:hypothetical protein